MLLKNNLIKLQHSLNDLLLNDNYKEDYNLIKQTTILVNSLTKKENITKEIITKINANINELNFKYIDLFELTNLYDPLKYELEKIVHDNFISELRKTNIEKRNEK